MDPIQVLAPDGTTVEFPAGTPDDVITRVMQAEFGGPDDAAYYDQPGLSESNPIDLRTISPEDGAGLTKGTWVRGADGTVYALPEDAYRGQQQPGDQPLEGGVIQRPQSTERDIAQSTGTGLVQGVTGTVGTPRAINDLQNQAVEFVGRKMGLDTSGAYDFFRQAEGLINPLSSGRGFSTEQLNRGLADRFGEPYAPQTTAGEYARTIGEFAPGALAPGGALTRIASVLVPALASEAAGQATEGRPEEGAARIVAGLLGGAPVGVANAVRSGPQSVLRNATRGLTEQQLSEATRLRTDAQRLGIALTQAEAVQQVTGGAMGLGRVQRVVEGSTNTIGPMMAQRPGQVRQAVGNLVNQVGEFVDPARATQLGQETAEGVINTMRQRVNQDARPFYDRLPGQTLDPADAATLQASPSYLRAQEEILSNPELAPLITGGPEDLSTVARVVRQLRTMREQATPTGFNTQGDNTIAAQRESARQLAIRLASEASPDFAMARVTGATGREAFVDPLRRGPLGTIAGQPELRSTLRQQTDALFPQAPAEGQADQTMLALQLMGEVNSQAGPALTRQFLATQANEILQDTPAGPNQFGGANFAARLMGNPEQERALLGAIDQAAPFNEARRLAEVLRATGQREAGGSRTADNLQLQQGMRGGNVGQESIRAVTNLGGIPARLGSFFDNFMTERNANKLAEILMANPATSEREIRRAMLSRTGGNRIRAGVALTQGGEE